MDELLGLRCLCAGVVKDPGQQGCLSSGCAFTVNLWGFRGRVPVQPHQFPSRVYHMIHKCACWISTGMRKRGMWALCFDCLCVIRGQPRFWCSGHILGFSCMEMIN